MLGFPAKKWKSKGIGDWLAIIKKKGYNDIFINHVNNIWLQLSDLPELFITQFLFPLEPSY